MLIRFRYLAVTIVAIGIPGLLLAFIFGDLIVIFCMGVYGAYGSVSSLAYLIGRYDDYEVLTDILEKGRARFNDISWVFVVITGNTTTQ